MEKANLTKGYDKKKAYHQAESNKKAEQKQKEKELIDNIKHANIKKLKLFLEQKIEKLDKKSKFVAQNQAQKRIKQFLSQYEDTVVSRIVDSLVNAGESVSRDFAKKILNSEFVKDTQKVKITYRNQWLYPENKTQNVYQAFDCKLVYIISDKIKKRGVVVTAPKQLDWGHVKPSEMIEFLDYFQDFRNRVSKIESESGL